MDQQEQITESLGQLRLELAALLRRIEAIEEQLATETISGFGWSLPDTTADDLLVLFTEGSCDD